MVSVSSSSPVNLDVHVMAMEQKEFYIEIGRQNSVIISPSQPHYVYYKFGKNDSDTILVEIESNDDVCLTVSVQNSEVRKNFIFCEYLRSLLSCH